MPTVAKLVEKTAVSIGAALPTIDYYIYLPETPLK